MTAVPHFELVVIGGGINGAGIAADCAGRGLKVALFEAGDLACATSSASSKLLHGGLRYLEHYEFRLVHEALAEREVMLRIAPHLTRPLRFRLPHRPHLRPAWLIRAGLWLYDHLALRVSLPASRSLRFGATDGLQPDIQRGFEYSDAWVDDARLVLLNALRAREQGAEIHPRTACTRARRMGDHWHLELTEPPGGRRFAVTCQALVNASGPWVTRFLDRQLALPASGRLRLSKGSHLVVPRVHDGAEAYLLQHRDGRVVFVIPYLQTYSLIGTTDVDYQGDARQLTISDPEIRYLCDAVNGYFVRQIGPADVIWSYAGVRPLVDDGSGAPQSVTRDYRLVLDAAPGQPPLLSVFGGKLTTYRTLAEAAFRQLRPFFPLAGGDWTATLPLPGGDFSGSVAELAEEYRQAFDWLDAPNARRIAEAYGSRARLWLRNDPGEDFGAGLTAAEVDYLIEQEWARSLEDILWRRSKLGLQLGCAEQARLQSYLDRRPTPAAPPDYA